MYRRWWIDNITIFFLLSIDLKIEAIVSNCLEVVHVLYIIDR